MYRLEEVAIPGFARHETFHPRYGWFRKGVAGAAGRPDIFTRDEAPVELGVGKNMVRAIRFWGKAAKVLTDAANPARPRMPLTAPTYRGLALFDDAVGLDAYLELPGSLWLLHWWMLSPPCLLSVWWLAFNQFDPVEFSDEELFSSVLEAFARSPKWELPVATSIKKDVDCLLRMYAPHVTGRFALDDLLDCPFRELGLLEPVWDDRKRFRFVLGAKPTLPAAVVAYACLDFLAVTEPNARTSTLSRLVHTPGSPGRAFKLTEEALGAALEEYGRRQQRVKLTSAAGLAQLTVDGETALAAVEALKDYYRDCGRPIPDAVRLSTDPVATPRLFDAAADAAETVLATELPSTEDVTLPVAEAMR